MEVVTAATLGEGWLEVSRRVPLADPEWLDWMRRNFTEPADVAELGGARSYARRLRDYEGRDQVASVIDRLRADPELARLQREVTEAIPAPVGSLVIHAKSAHIYEPEFVPMRGLTSAAALK